MAPVVCPASAVPCTKYLTRCDLVASRGRLCAVGILQGSVGVPEQANGARMVRRARQACADNVTVRAERHRRHDPPGGNDGALIGTDGVDVDWDVGVGAMLRSRFPPLFPITPVSHSNFAT